MHKKGTAWSPEEIEAMRRELLEGRKTLDEVAEREDVTRQRIAQLVGRLDRPNTWKQETRKQVNLPRVSALLETGISDEEIASEVELAISTIRSYRTELGFRRPNPRYHTARDTIRLARLWFEKYGFSPGAADWIPGLAKHMGHLERVTRLEEFSKMYGRPPGNSAIQRLFGSWGELIHQAGLPPVPRGPRGFMWRKAEENGQDAG